MGFSEVRRLLCAQCSTTSTSATDYRRQKKNGDITGITLSVWTSETQGECSS